jgi:hypothetical protein
MTECKPCKFIAENKEIGNYIKTRLSTNCDLQELYDEIVSTNEVFDFSLVDLVEHKKQCNILTINYGNDNEEENTPKIEIDFTEGLREFKDSDLVEQSAICNRLLAEINYKLIFIINEKLDFYKDRVPKEDIQALKIINDMVYKPDIKNDLQKDVITREQAEDYANKLINKLLKSNSLTKDESLELLKIIVHEKMHNHLFKPNKTSII